MTDLGATLVLAGEFDWAEEDRLRGHLLHAENAGEGVVVVDVTDVVFIETVALGVLDEARLRLSAKGRGLELVGARSHLRRLCRAAGYPELVAQ